MQFSFKPEDNVITRDTSGKNYRHWLIALVVFLAVISAGTWALYLEASEEDAQRKVGLVVRGAALKAQIDRELGLVLNLTSSLRSYLVVRQKSLERDEIENILATMYGESQHIKNFTVAVGHRISYIHPLAGNEKAIGLLYPDLPEQWTAVKKTIDSGKPALLGPVKLVQGGEGLIYRVPIFIHGHYWGMLSSVFDSESLFVAMSADSKTRGLELAIRGVDGLGMQGKVFRGDAGLFTDKNAQLIDVDIPGGKWVLAVRSTATGAGSNTLWLLQGLVCLLALALAWSVLIVLSQRSKLARLALFDALTGLPNRMLIDDRVDRAMTNLRRDPEKACLLMFVDLDRFKLINDQHGHHAGDFALQSTAGRVGSIVREADTVGRWGGDEFLVFMENVDRAKIGDLCAKIRSAVEQPFEYRGNQLTLGVSIGYALAPDDGSRMDELLRVADARMYADKKSRNAAR